MITEILLGAAALLILNKRKQTIEGIGRIKRRVYVEIEAAQKAGVPLHEKYINLSSGDIDTLRELGERFGWKQTRRSVESGKAYSEAYFNSLRRAYNAITGVRGIGDVHKVRNANGDVVLEWRDIEAAAAHVAQERDLAELEARLAKQRRSIRNARKGRNMVPAQSTYQNQQLYEQSNFPDHPQQLALFGVGSHIHYFGGNSGYDGYSMSKRALVARDEGKFPKTDFKKIYGINSNSLEVLTDLGIISDKEWHHTSMYGNRTTFYAWADADNDDKTLSYSDIYAKNKKEIDRLCKDYLNVPEVRFSSKLILEDMAKFPGLYSKKDFNAEYYFEEDGITSDYFWLVIVPNRKEKIMAISDKILSFF